jgi:murein DD-endopeptidase MepM/ murein hydrolase activator NlpD
MLGGMRIRSAIAAAGLAGVLGAAGPVAAAPIPPDGTPGVGWAAAAASRPPAALRTWRSPVLPLRVLRGFAPPERDWLPGHRGVDLAVAPAQPVRAARAGVVRHATALAGRGVVVVDHGALRTTYEPVEAVVAVGQWVAAGEAVGVVAPGTGHCGTGRCLHLGLRRGAKYLDPLLILTTSRARLRPW